MFRRKTIVAIGACLMIACVILLVTVINGRYQYAQPQPYYNVSRSTANSLFLIGDSWAAYASGRGFDKYLSGKIGMEVRSKGFPGYTSRDIYNLLYVSGDGGLKDIVMSKPKYIVLVCGINDMHGQYGPKFYSYHTSLIVNALLHHGINVVYLEIPRWDISRQYEYYSFTRKAEYNALYFFTTGQSNLADAIDAYRSEFEKQLSTLNKSGHFFYLQSDFLDESKYWSDNMHLNEEGYRCLADSVARIVSVSASR